ncbi:hypothetical protein ID875_06640 [Streptomyces globisporus]|uniref:Uncharacterized protein n=1 Tax=Streptomyces globisporus TaxID=1908 RepID=A0A927BJQ3_STRGL|nr:hypothetical protein [Streptomyces globisporus]
MQRGEGQQKARREEQQGEGERGNAPCRRCAAAGPAAQEEERAGHADSGDDGLIDEVGQGRGGDPGHLSGLGGADECERGQ